jgi:endoglucanase
MDYTLLTQLTETPGISGREEKVRELVRDQLASLTTEISIDAMGSLIAHLPGAGPRVVLVAHMDEVGFLVSKIEEAGFLRVMPVGGVDPRVFGAQKVMVHGRKGVLGIVGSIPPHLIKQTNGSAGKEALSIEESFIDTGLPPEEVRNIVRVGDPVTFAADGWENEAACFARALDDRVGIFIMMTAVKQAKKIDCDLYIVASTQEEYGLRGVGPAVFGIQPKIVIALDGTVASDTPALKLPANTTPTAQGKGPEIRLTDKGMISDRELADFLVHTAEDAGIPCQMIVKNTGATDAARGQTVAAGVKATALSVPVRYIHAPIGMVQKTDIIHSIRLVVAFLERASKMGCD